MTVIEKGHITDTALEDYSLNHLAEPELEVVEEHILICPTCQDRLEEVDDFVKAFRMAHVNLEAQNAGTGMSGGGGLSPVSFEDFPNEKWVPRLAPTPAWFQQPAVWAGLSFVLVLGVAIPLWRAQRTTTVATRAEVVSLLAQRGANSNAEAKEGRLTLQLDLQGVNNGAVAVEVATWDGKPVWQRTIPRPSASEQVMPEVSFAAGQYWVRVRSSDSTLLREFGLRVRGQ